MLRGLVTRAADGDLEAIEQLQRLDQVSGQALRLGTRLAHDQAGYSWSQLGDALQVSRQAAQQSAAASEPVAALWPRTLPRPEES